MREHGSIAKLATKYRKFKDVLNEIEEVKVMAESSDSDEQELAKEEMPNLLEQREKLWSELLDMTVGGEDATRGKCVIEIRYKRHAENKGWKLSVQESNSTEMGGFKEIILSVSGEGSFRELQYESGGHRVQRVPETETKGRIHTSAATVAVMAEPEDVEVDLKPDDYTTERYAASSGAGGQHVNKTASAIRLVHKETGIEVKCREERSQHKNLAKAIRRMKTKLYDHYQQQEAAQRAGERKSLVGSGDRSQRIRTYNFPDNRVTDHRINLTLYKLDQVIAGKVDMLTEALIDHDRQQLRDSMGSLD